MLRSDAPDSIRGRASFTSVILWDLYSQLTNVVKTGRPLPAACDGFNLLAEHPGLAVMHETMVESSIRVIGNLTRRLRTLLACARRRWRI